jgi:hypothetical protein
MSIRTHFLCPVACLLSVAACGQPEHGRAGPGTSGGALEARTASDDVIVDYGDAPGTDHTYGDTEPAPLRTRTVAPEASPEAAPARQPSEERAPHVAIGRALIRARCEREARCGNVGEDHDYADTATCIVGSIDVWSSSFDCPDGVAPARLDACADAVRDADCDTDMFSLDRLPPCRSTNVCRR